MIKLTHMAGAFVPARPSPNKAIKNAPEGHSGLTVRLLLTNLQGMQTTTV